MHWQSTVNKLDQTLRILSVNHVSLNLIYFSRFLSIYYINQYKEFLELTAATSGLSHDRKENLQSSFLIHQCPAL